VSYIVNVDQQEFKVDVRKEEKGYTAYLNGAQMSVEVARDDGNQLTLIVNNRPYVIDVESDDQVRVNGESYSVTVIDERIQELIKASPETVLKKELAVKAVMPGLVIDVTVKEGAPVKVGDALLVVEAMKMQNEVKTPRDGLVKKILVQKGKTVNTGDTLLIIE
jgi:biotin carboxyl carrier protein